MVDVPFCFWSRANGANGIDRGVQGFYHQPLQARGGSRVGLAVGAPQIYPEGTDPVRRSCGDEVGVTDANPTGGPVN